MIIEDGFKRGKRSALAIRSCLISVTALVSATAARPSAIDCKSAKTNQDRAVCHNNDLLDADRQIAKLYKVAIPQLSPAGAKQLREGQRQWLAYVHQACPVRTSKATFEEHHCLDMVYRDRVDDLRHAAVRSGPFLFTRIDSYSAETAPPDQDQDDITSQDARPGLKHIAVPQIDRPLTPTAVQWNQLAQRSDPEADCGPPDGDVSLTYMLGLATNRLISVSWTDLGYCHGHPHGYGQTQVETTVLTPKMRPLEAGDLFRPGSAWEPALIKLTTEAVEQAAREHEDDLSHLNRDAIADVATTPERWLLLPTGLRIAFDPYELGEGYPFAPAVTLPWSALKDVLVTDPTKP